MRAGSPRPATTTSVTESLPGPSIPVGANRSWGTTAAIGLITPRSEVQIPPRYQEDPCIQGFPAFRGVGHLVQRGHPPTGGFQSPPHGGGSPTPPFPDPSFGGATDRSMG